MWRSATRQNSPVFAVTRVTLWVTQIAAISKSCGRFFRLVLRVHGGLPRNAPRRHHRMAASDTVPAFRAQSPASYPAHHTFSPRAIAPPVRWNRWKSPRDSATQGGRALRLRDSSSNQSTRSCPAARTSPVFPHGRITLRRALQRLARQRSGGSLEIIRRPLARAGSRDLQPHTRPIRHMDAVRQFYRILFDSGRDTHRDSVMSALLSRNPFALAFSASARLGESISPPLSSTHEAVRPPLLGVEAVEQPNSKQVWGGEQKL